MYVIMIAKPASGYVLAGAAGHQIDLFGAIELGNPFGEGVGLNHAARAVHIATGVAFLAIWVVHVAPTARSSLVF